MLARRVSIPVSAQTIMFLGGLAAVARILGVTATAVLAWKKKGIPETKAVLIWRRFVEIKEENRLPAEFVRQIKLWGYRYERPRF